MCQVPKAFKQNSFIIKLLEAIEEQTGWKDKYGEYKFVPMESIPPRFHDPSRSDINSAIYMLIYMINLCYQSTLENDEDAKLEKWLYENIDKKFPNDINYAANALVNIAQIIALRNPVTAYYLGLAKQAVPEKNLGSNLWKIILDVTVNMFLNNLRGRQISAEEFKRIFERRMEELGNNLQNFIIEKRNTQLSKLHFTGTRNPVLDETNPWAHYLAESKNGQKKKKN
ncbi:hypothetical protein A2303_03235 [Candidatus Falkowbacteria bacterium RIFOXYB2_FULL_47_14]|uniref:Uncharacterized protein n=1 Tax=Candidatus Falkowbacteria bacterium RIFOXYA2_FULL_47_19 TaxID=1797994 RepID=A0A1F5SFP3_9BACT|nr:MAG: hypothetical protein A2227_07740 [Candidatus Falkowbacteria bacterium RIFOXYA2_FULL_47_19]OGF35200.1 MAG: hypothetical protein A2468_02070 [Candidatus Falkowbacteria bacterium RIFOXYC2_FULL_46_15]OGF43365.1 MAG: hypothetical protein A2303_03235 [Candidatus Falkowbacteria bacterium RIFOXYB2_FULL_47_14]